MTGLPKILEHEPFVNALFEVRLDGSVPHADILPGFLFHQLDPKPTIIRLPAAEFPQPVRTNDPNLRYAPIQRLEWGNYVIAVGDQTIVISCKLPYPKWPNFRSKILETTAMIADAGVVGKVERFSVKYVNLIRGDSLAGQIVKIDMAIRIGSLEVQDDHISMQVHHVEDDTLHILTVITDAHGRMPDGSEAHGVVIDIDSIRNIQPVGFKDFAAGLEPELEKLRQSNKIKFFGCLKQETIDQMGPIYG